MWVLIFILKFMTLLLIPLHFENKPIVFSLVIRKLRGLFHFLRIRCSSECGRRTTVQKLGRSFLAAKPEKISAGESLLVNISSFSVMSFRGTFRNYRIAVRIQTLLKSS